MNDKPKRSEFMARGHGAAVTIDALARWHTMSDAEKASLGFGAPRVAEVLDFAQNAVRVAKQATEHGNASEQSSGTLAGAGATVEPGSAHETRQDKQATGED